MTDDFLVILDECLAQIAAGATIEKCLAEHAKYRSELEPLLLTARRLSAMPEVNYPADRLKISQERILNRIRIEEEQKTAPLNSFSCPSLFRSLAFRMLVPVALVLVIALIITFAIPVFSPAPISAAEFTLSILKGTAEVCNPGNSEWLSGTDGKELAVGTRVRAARDSIVLLTFFDGSTTRLEPGSEVLVSRSEYNDAKQVNIELEQSSGKTWNYVISGQGQNTGFSVKTPQIQAEAAGTAFSVEVSPLNKTALIVAEGQVRILEREREIMLAQNQQIEVGDVQVSSEPQPAPPAENEMVVITALPGVGSVRNPDGASTGYLPDGVSFNQISNSNSSISSTGQSIIIREPAPGEYILAVRSISAEVIPVNIALKHRGRVVFEYSDSLTAKPGEGWLLKIELTAQVTDVYKGKIASIIPLAGEQPERIIETELARQRAVPVGALTVTPVPAPTGTIKINETGPASSTPDTTAVPGVSADSPVSPTSDTELVGDSGTSGSKTGLTSNITATPAATSNSTVTPEAATPADTPVATATPVATPAVSATPSATPVASATPSATPVKTPEQTTSANTSNETVPAVTPAPTAIVKPTATAAPTAVTPSPTPTKTKAPVRNSSPDDNSNTGDDISNGSTTTNDSGSNTSSDSGTDTSSSTDSGLDSSGEGTSGISDTSSISTGSNTTITTSSSNNTASSTR